jgi:3',5'-cyclic AMP phosphodiesterase CpdA
MTAACRLAVTADLHWGQNPRGDQATLALRDFLLAQPPDLLLLAGDQGTAGHFDECLALFRDLPCPKALVPGNHDLWVQEGDSRGDSLTVYREHLPRVSAAHGFHYLDAGPLFLADGPAVVGTINWYDYSWSLERLRELVPDYEKRLRHKLFTRGRHNDARFIRWPLDDVRFTQQVVATFEEHLAEATKRADKPLIVAHHPPFYGLGFPREGPPSVPDGLLWDAFSGNTAIEQLLRRHAERIGAIFCGHTHRARASAVSCAAGYNVGGDYHFKRLLLVEWPALTVAAHVFGDPVR